MPYLLLVSQISSHRVSKQSPHEGRKSQIRWEFNFIPRTFSDLFIGLEGRVFTNGPGDLGSIPGRVRPDILKMGLDTSWLNTQQYKLRIKGKVKQLEKGVAPAPIPRCSSCWKGSLQVALDYDRQLYFYIYIYIQRARERERERERKRERKGRREREWVSEREWD